MKLITKILNTLGYVPKDKKLPDFTRKEEKIQKVLDYANSLSWSTRDFIHYVGNDIEEEKLNISKENAQLLSLVGGKYQYQYKVDIDRLLNNVLLKSTTANPLYEEFKKYGINILFNMPAKYWIEFCIQLVDKNDKEAALTFIKDSYNKDKTIKVKVEYLPVYGKIIVNKFNGDFVSTYSQGDILPENTEICDLDIGLEG